MRKALEKVRVTTRFGKLTSRSAAWARPNSPYASSTTTSRGAADGGDRLATARLAGRVVRRAPEGEVGARLGHQVDGHLRGDRQVARLHQGDGPGAGGAGDEGVHRVGGLDHQRRAPRP